MRIDRPDDGTLVPARDAAEITGEGTDVRRGAPDIGSHPADDPGRAAIYARYQATVEAEYRMAASYARWETAKAKLEAEWAHHVMEQPARRSGSPAFSTQESREAVERGCRSFRETEEKITTPAMSRIEAADPQRCLVGLERRCKGEDRIMEKVARQMEAQADLTPAEALASVKDAIRYTFRYSEDRYTEGVNADIDRLKAAGFALVELRNSWGSEEYKGINSRWQVPENGQLFEVQFHTQVSFEAKQLTHPAYEHLRNPSTSKAVRDQLEAFHRRVNACIPVPQGALTYPDYP